MSLSRTLSLRSVVFVDAAVCAVSGIAVPLLAVPLSGLLRLPEPFLFYSGLILLPIAAFFAFVASRDQPHPAAVWAVIAGNAAWVVASFGVLLAGLVTPNELGVAFIVVQALAVALLAGLEYMALQRSPKVVAG